MAEQGARILLVEDEAAQRKTLSGFLRKRGLQVHEAASASEAEQLVHDVDVDLMITDLRLGGPDGISLLATLRQSLPDLQCLVLTAYGTVEDAVRAMKAGAYDFVAKPVDLRRLESLVHKALERVALARENRGLREVVKASGAFDELIGDSEAMRRTKELALKVAVARSSVLVLGESGTGKELLARAIHLASPRRAAPFVAVNCAALPEGLIEAELFGHAKGAFTGAGETRDGRFALAHCGSLFLDEVGDIPLPVQVKLLRVLQERCIERVGSSTSQEVDVRVIAATHRDLEARIGAGLFREDLYYRLNVISITLPPLRERPEDIPLLAHHFLRKHADVVPQPVRAFAPAVLQRLAAHPFPGNVRQLENWIERAVVLADSDQLTLEDFPAQLVEAVADGPRPDLPQSDMLCAGEGGLEDEVAELETERIRTALQLNQGNKSAAARELKLTERAIRYKMKKYGID